MVYITFSESEDDFRHKVFENRLKNALNLGVFIIKNMGIFFFSPFRGTVITKSVGGYNEITYIPYPAIFHRDIFNA